MNYSCVDITLYTNNLCECSKMNFLYNEINNSITIQSNKYQINVQLKWGDFDQYDIDTYSKFKFFEYSNDNNYL